MVALALTVTALLTAPAAAGAPTGCGSLGGTIRNGYCQITAAEPGYSLDLRYPLGYPAEDAVIGYLGQARDGFLNLAGEPDTRGRPYEFDVTAQEMRSVNTRSVVLTLFQNVGGAHPSTWYKSFTYDIARGIPVTFDTLFAPGTRALDVIFPLVQNKLEADTGLTGGISPGDGLDPAHYQNFAVTDDAVIFFFGRGELLPSYAGETSVSLARSSIPPLQV